MALAQFEGTLILVSHDRHLLRATTDQFMLVAEHGCSRSTATSTTTATGCCSTRPSNARPRRPTARRPLRSPASIARIRSARPPRSVSACRSWKKPLQNRISKLEKQMETLHAEKARLDAFVADPASYEAARKTELTDAIRTLGEVTTRLEAVEAEWLAVQEELEQIG
jgi:ATP-binding cassette subfamily F protein 3